MSDESGTNEIYVQSFPRPGNKVRISPSGGLWPQWRKDGLELYYIAPDGKLMGVSVKSGQSGLVASAPQALFEAPPILSGATLRNQYWPSGTGEKFLFNARIEDPSPQAITIGMNWTAGLEN